MINLDFSIKGLFLLILALSGGYVSETLGCQTQNFITNNMDAKYILIFFLLYYSIHFTNSTNLKTDSPLISLVKTLIIYIVFILFTRMNLNFTILVFLLSSLIYLLIVYIEYYSDNYPNDPIINKLKQSKNVLYILTIIIIVIGFIDYYLFQRKKHYKKWDPIKFIFGVRKCNFTK